jgi:hypothetical protein
LSDPGGTEGVRLDDVGARLQVGVVDAGHHVGTGEDQHLVVAGEVAGVIPESLAAEVGLGEALGLDHRTHRAVDDEDALGEQRFELRAVVGFGHGIIRLERRRTAASARLRITISQFPDGCYFPRG